MAAPSQDEQRLALFVDFENIAIGVRDAHYRKFDINLVLERLLDKGKLLVKKAYADWSRYADYKRAFHEAAIELIEVPQKSVGGKNSADIRLVVDAMDMSFQKEHINCFVVASGDSDFSPLVSKLKENNKYVIGLGVKNSTSDLLIENCDEFIFYEDLVRGQHRPLPQMANVNEKLQECFSLLIDSVLALQRENKEVLWGSMVKETMKRKKPSFNETYYGFRTFSSLLEDAQKRGLVTLRRDQRSGSYIIEDLGASTAAMASAAAGRSEARSESRGEGRAETSARSEGAPTAGAAAARGESRASENRAGEARAAEPATANAPAAEASEAGTNGARPARRRRSRSRRARGVGVTPGLDGAPSPSDEVLDLEENEDDSDDLDAEEREEASTPPVETPRQPEPRPAPAAAAPAERPAPPTHHERSPFSFFSSLFRRDDSAAEATPPATPGTPRREDD